MDTKTTNVMFILSTMMTITVVVMQQLLTCISHLALSCIASSDKTDKLFVYPQI